MHPQPWEHSARPPLRIVGLLLATFMLLSVVICTPSGWAQTGGKWRYYDSTEKTFQIGAVGFLFPKIGLDTLGITFSRFYGIANPGILRNMIDHPGWWNERLDSTFWYQSNALGYKVIGPLPNMARAAFASRYQEHYAAYDSTSIQAMTFERGPDTAAILRDSTVLHGLAWPVLVPQADTLHAAPLLIAAGPRYTANYLFQIGDRGLYDIIGLMNRWTSYRVGVTLNISGKEFNDLDDPTLVAYILLYRRARNGQTDCKCHIYEPFDSIPIRAGDYRNALFADSNRTFREISKLVDFKRSQEVRRHDTLALFHVTVFNDKGDSLWLRDSVVVVNSVYSRDSLNTVLATERPGMVLSPGLDTIAHSGAYPERYTVVRYDTIVYFHVQLYVPQGDEFAYGIGQTYFGEPYGFPCNDSCTARFTHGLFPSGSINEPVYNSDFDMRIFSTGVVPITFLRTRIYEDMYDHLRAGHVDDYIKRDIDNLYSVRDTVINHVIGRLALPDEPISFRLRTGGYLSRAMQAMMRAAGDTVRQMWQNPPGNFDGYRLLMEDFDTTSVKTVQNMTRQDYHTIGAGGIYGNPDAPADRIPQFYANPDSMDTVMMYTLYRARDTMMRWQDSLYKRNPSNPGDCDDTLRDSFGRPVLDTAATNANIYRDRMIAFSNDADYHTYTAMRQRAFGLFLKSIGDSATNVGELVPMTARAVDVGKLKYARLGPPCSVWNMIQCGAWINGDKYPCPRNERGGNWYRYWSDFRPPTPEEITVQVWLTIACGADGIIYTDGVWDGTQMGFINAYNGDHARDYDTLPMSNPDILSADPLRMTFPKMWYGFYSKFNAIRHVDAEIRKLDSAIHLTDLRYRREQMTVHDLRQSFASFPLVDTLWTQRAKPFDTATGQPYLEDGTADSRDSTYVELTHFLPSPRDTASEHVNSHLVMIVNRRTWPVDRKHYDSVAQMYGADSIGLGAVDVRRPYIRLKNTTGILLDSFIVEKVGHESQWRDTVAVGADVALDWLEPGWGVFYRIRPLPSPISKHGTAWNNAIHAENPSSDSTQRDRIVVYEHDSTVYMRVMDAAGAISHEWIISDPDDTVMQDKGGGEYQRTANNVFPAFATLRGDTAMKSHTVRNIGCMVVWERFASDSLHSIEMLYIDSLPTRAGGVTTSTLRWRLAAARKPIRSWMYLAPSIVAVRDSGFVVAWASPSGSGVEAIAVRKQPGLLSLTLGSHDTSRTVHARKWHCIGAACDPGDTVCQFPTLAWCPRRIAIDTGLGTFSQAPPPDTSGGPIPLGKFYDTLSAVHLAYQQGSRSNAGWKIMYNLLGVVFDLADSVPRVWLSETEEVSRNVHACEHLHPSISVDTSFIGVAWQAELGTSTIVLRFRDPLKAIDTALRMWTLPAYRWGGGNMIQRRPGWSGLRSYRFPSVTQYPALDSLQLRSIPEGGIVWQWTNAPDNRHNRLVFYRFGEGGVDTSLADGFDPTMMLLPNVKASRSTAFIRSSIFHRGADAEQFTGARPYNDSAFYYPGYIINTPVVPSPVFSQPFAFGRAIVGVYDIAPADQFWSQCPSATAGLRIGVVLGKPPFIKRRLDTIIDGPFPPIAPPPPFTEWPVPPTFFPAKTDSTQWITTLSAASQVARTGNFHAGSSPLSVRRILTGSDSLITWLNSQPYDTSASAPANVRFSMQLVRRRDDSVLWAGDTISARRIGADTVDQTLSIPVDTYAPADTVVYVRMYGVASPHMQYLVSGEFQFVQDTDDVGTFKRTAPGSLLETTEGAIAVAMIPNPVRANQGELHVLLREAGRASIALYDLVGNAVLRPGDLDVESAGEYAVPVDLSSLRDGVYVVEVKMGRERGTTRFTVMR